MVKQIYTNLNKTNEAPRNRGFLLAKKHILSARQFSREEAVTLLGKAATFEKFNKPGRADTRLKGHIIATLFYEPSTRTRFSFETAAQNLGAFIISAENSSVSSSSVKGESLEDTIRIVGGYSDAIVLRHPELGAAERAARVSSIPIINAGDGAGSHPTQALLDLYTIKKELGRLADLKIALVGDLLYGRAARSFCQLISKFTNITIYLVSPAGLGLSGDVRNFLVNQGITIFETSNLDKVIAEVDVLYMTRIQKERFENEKDYLKLKGSYKLNKRHLKKIKANSIILHPLPRVDEIDSEVDQDRRAAYFRQAANGVAVRMAVLDSILS